MVSNFYSGNRTSLSRKIFILILLSFLLSACTNRTDTNNTAHGDLENHSHGDASHHMHMSSSGEVPENLLKAAIPTYKVGSKAIIRTDHMEGMDGTEATIIGAYDTTAYAISYTPSTGGDRIENHKWVVHEELIDVHEPPLTPGTKAKTKADHMVGMEDATVEIDSAIKTTVYMVNFLTTNGIEVKNHKWVIESELEPAD